LTEGSFRPALRNFPATLGHVLGTLRHLAAALKSDRGSEKSNLNSMCYA
jgi:hypothetical protein